MSSCHENMPRYGKYEKDYQWCVEHDMLALPSEKTFMERHQSELLFCAFLFICIAVVSMAGVAVVKKIKDKKTRCR